MGKYRKYKAAVVQMDSGNHKMDNLKKAEKYLAEAAMEGACLVCFPEDMNLVGENAGEGGEAEDIPGLTTDFLVKKAKDLGVYIHSGSFRKRIPGDHRFYNTSVLVDPEGKILAEYHKIHMFDVTLPDGTVSEESRQICPGNEVVLADTALGCFGFSICYDIRFPELYRSMALGGAQIIFAPADFTDATGRAHWEVLLRARAIENGCYIIAADQCGKKPAYLAHGNSMIVDPWGSILARAGQTPEILYAEIDPDFPEQVRSRIPSLSNRREDVYHRI